MQYQLAEGFNEPSLPLYVLFEGVASELANPVAIDPGANVSTEWLL
jgi:hypothetical protein